VEKKKKKQKCRLKTGNGVITALTAGSKMLPTICIDQSSTGSTVQRCMERMIAVALTSTYGIIGLRQGIGDNDGLGFAKEKKRVAYLEGFDVARSGIY